MPQIRVVHRLRYATPCSSQPLPKPRTAWARAGLRYERSALRSLAELSSAVLRHNPWFYFEDDNGPGYISPDIILAPLTLVNGPLIVAECKLTYKSEAITKLRRLYCPVISMVFGRTAQPLVIVKNLTQDAPPAGLTITDSLDLACPILHWPGRGPILWDRPAPQWAGRLDTPLEAPLEAAL